ncbi:MAG: DUF805 domain-containing protein [Roseibacillus sp.]
MPDNLHQAPVAQFSLQNANPPTLRQRLFSFKGRFSRSHYWGYGLGIGSLISTGMTPPYLIIIFMIIVAEQSGTTAHIPTVTILALLILAFCVLALWVCLAATAKRFHDRGKSGWMAALHFIPFVGGIWVIIECGCLVGTPGPNLHGSDPLGRR